MHEAGPADREAPVRLGEILVEEGLITPAQLDEALDLQRRWGSRLGDIVLARGWVRAWDFYRGLSRHFGLEFVNLQTDPPDPDLFATPDVEDYNRRLVLPWRLDGGVVTVATADFSAQTQRWARERYGPDTRLVGTAKFDILWQLQSLGNDHFIHNAHEALATRTPELSAKRVFTSSQLAALYLMASALLWGLASHPIGSLLVLNCLVTVFLAATFGLKFVLAWVGSAHQIDVKVTDEETRSLDDAELPVYTVLVPMYQEPDTLPILAAALRKMDYPLSKLDIKLVLEEGDTQTIQAARDLGLEAIFEIIRVPPVGPKTKPKACNYALTFARGQFVTIYDAEDKPDPDQLKKAVVAFKKAGPRTACVQARLNYFNADENWLTRMFTLEYSLWFDYYLPALEKLRIPIPLGGTSNHFRFEILRDLHAWDPYNVTEDADLGVRLTQRGYEVGVVNSTTYEEANCDVHNWIRQRSRWIKGYMQTYLVHMRNPLKLYRTLGHKGFWGFQFFIGGNFLTALSTPILWGMYFFWLFTRSHVFDPIFPTVMLYISLLNLLAGNGFFIYLTLVGAFKRGLFKVAPYAATVPAYWLLMSVAGYKALWQLVYNPFFWEKTIHGLSKYTAVERHKALST